METVDVIVAAGELSEHIQQILNNEDGTLSLETESNGFLLHRFGNRIIFEALIDTPIDTQRERVLAALLTYNAVWQETGFIRMALTGSGSDARVTLIADIILDETFTPQYVANVVEDLDAKIQIWRDIIAGGANDGSDIHGDENTVRV